MLLKTPRNDACLLSLTCFFFSQVDLPGAVLRNMSAMLDLDASQDAFDASVATIANKTPRYKKYPGILRRHSGPQSIQERTSSVRLQCKR